MKAFVVVCCSLVALCSAAPRLRIAGGDDAVLGQIPYQAGLSIAGLPTCGVIILSENYALTVMQCVCSQGSDIPQVWPPQMFSIIAGTTDLYTGGVRIPLQEIIVNPNYNEFSIGIAILKFSKPLVFSATIQAIALSSENPPNGAEVEVSGWGRIKETKEDMHRTLQLNEAIVLSTEECQRYLANTDSQIICLGHARKNGICRGDFGGPAVHQGQLVGVAAYIIGECGSALPDVFTSVAVHHNWIMAQIKQSL